MARRLSQIHAFPRLSSVDADVYRVYTSKETTCVKSKSVVAESRDGNFTLHVASSAEIPKKTPIFA